MNVDEAIEHFANADEFPREALQWALDNWEDASPRFISKLRAYAEGAPESEVDLDGLFFIIQLCGVKHDTRAYVPLCDVIAADTTFYDKFGGGMVDNLPGILINVCDGDVEPLKRAIEAPEGDEFCRAAAIEALAYLVRTRSVLSDEEMQRYLSHLGSELQPRGENQIWSAWAFAIAQLGYRTLRAEAGRVFAREWIGPCAGTLDEFDQALQLARRDADGLAAFAAWCIVPFGSTLSALEDRPPVTPKPLRIGRENFDLSAFDGDRLGDGILHLDPFRDDHPVEARRSDRTSTDEIRGSSERANRSPAMNVDEAMRRFANASEFPREALQWALDNWDEASPRLISKLRAHAGGARGPDFNGDVLLYIVHLCGEKCDARAYVPLCDLIANDETLYDWLGDAISENLTGILINVCDGDAEPLQRAIEAAEGDPEARCAAIDALSYLVRFKAVLAEQEMQDYLSRLADEMRPRSEHQVWSAWAFAIARLGYESMRGSVARVFSKGWIDRTVGDLDDFHQELQSARTDPNGRAAFVEAGFGPFGSTIESLDGWYRSEFGEPRGGYDFDALPGEPLAEAGPLGQFRPHVNPFRDIGRNDPCPCGSGKKYKKCCLAA